MVNHAKADELRLELRKLQQQKEDYEDFCKKFKKQMNIDADEFHEIGYDLSCLHNDFLGLDSELSNIIQDNQEVYKQLQNGCDDLSILTDEEQKRYNYRCEGEKEEILRAINRLEMV